jgi:hypothetical protein
MKVIPETYRVNYIGCLRLYCIVLSYVFMPGLICFLFNQLMYLIIDIPFSLLIQIILYTVQLNLSRYLEVHGIVAKFRVIRNST